MQSCANQSAPPGGKKDVNPPVLIKSNPSDGQVNVPQKVYIKLHFDEWVDAGKVKTNTIISPKIDAEINVKSIKNKIIINTDKPLNTLTTYTLNINEGIKDNTEGNVLKHLSLSFSTGNFIDSCMVQGMLYDCYSQDTAKNCLVGLYANVDSINPEKHIPTYYTYSDKKGKFIIKHIKSDSYKIYAFSDINKNLKYDNYKEKIGFIDSTVTLVNNTLSGITMQLSASDYTKPKINAIKNDQNIKISFSEGILKYTLSANTNLKYAINTNPKELIIYKHKLCEDTVDAHLHIVDSSYNDTTIIVKLVLSSPKKFNRYKDVIAKVLPPTGSEIYDSLVFEVNLHEPYDREADSLILINIDSLVYKKLSLINNFKTTDNAYTRFTYSYYSKPKKFIDIHIKKNKLYNMLGDTNTEYKMRYVPYKKKDADIIYTNINIETDEDAFIFQLLKDKEVITTKYTEKKIKLENLPIGKYSIKIIADPNKNRRWDNSNYRKNIQPERVKLFRNVLIIKENFDIDEQNIKF
ncbi:MAG: Ig-like domain-containing protein [Cytophagales bacterium]|nr:Ig-like domain-containing protein [Cytophagales bacterium]